MLKHGGSDIYNITQLVEDYSVTTNLLGPCASGLNNITNNLEKINHYPSEDKKFFQEGLDFLHVDESSVLWGNGASELIDLAIRTLVKLNEYTTYSKFNNIQYMEYERCCKNNGLVETELGDILLIINPNNPTGDFYNKDFIINKIKMMKNGSTIIIDESMIFWIGPSWYDHSFLSEKKYINELKINRNINILLVQSWTKIFSCTGLRFGSLVSYDLKLIKEFEKYKTPWSANILSYSYLQGCLLDKNYLNDTWERTPKLRLSIANKINEIFPFAQVKGCDFLSWLWVDFIIEDLADAIYTIALEYGIPVRYGEVGYAQPSHIRFAVRNEKSNIILFEMLERVKSNKINIPKYYFNIPNDLVYGIIKIPLDKIKSHEEYIPERKNKLLEYLNGNDYFVLPSMIVDVDTFVILDGHHRLNILKDIGKTEEYVLLVNYKSNAIIAHETDSITKNEIINAGVTGKLLAPKSSKHIFMDSDNIKRPLISLSVIINN